MRCYAPMLATIPWQVVTSRGIVRILTPIIGPISWLPILATLPFAWACAPARRPNQISARLGGSTWNRNDFCRGWLITGDTGSGKTFAINALLHTVFQNEPDWGGLCCDEKGIYHETLVQMADLYGRQHDLLLLQTRPDNAGEDCGPTRSIQSSFRFNHPLVDVCDGHCRYSLLFGWRQRRQRIF